GFIGTLMVVQPSFATVGWPALLPVATAFLFTGFLFLTRRITPYIAPIDLQAVNGVCAVVMMLPLLAWGTAQGIGEIRLVPTTQTQLIYLLGVGLLGTLAHLSMTYALKFTKPTTVAPVQYLEIPFGAAFGFIAFTDIPNGMAAFGICIVILSGLLVLFATPK
ncbi:MAG: EamA family transporter, partial [Pseudomonadota bacterium]